MAAGAPNGDPRHCVAVIGGAVAGAEVAGALADAGCEVAVFEQNARPYGKIEDGLPRWHVALRRKEYDVIGGKLSKPSVHFVPETRIGRDVGFGELVREWGFSGVVLACGAWRDRPLPVEGAEEYVGRGLVYQNPFIIWFNHANEAGYEGPRFTPEPAAIDVVKALMLETARAKLRERGIDQPMVELEVKGIPKICQRHGLSYEDLGLEGCTLFYRRDAADMPLMEMPQNATPEREKKVRTGRERMLAKAMEKYRFNFEPLCMPDGLLVEDGRLVGLRFRRTKMEGGRPRPTDETFERRGPYVISSIGSIPEPIPEIPMKGELFDFADWDLGRLGGYPTVFSAGNVVTGKGNIVASRKHADHVAEAVIEGFLGVAEGGHAGEEELVEAMAARARAAGEDVAKEIQSAPALSPEALEAVRARVRERQRAVGFEGDYARWIERVTPPDLE